MIFPVNGRERKKSGIDWGIELSYNSGWVNIVGSFISLSLTLPSVPCPALFRSPRKKKGYIFPLSEIINKVLDYEIYEVKVKVYFTLCCPYYPWIHYSTPIFSSEQKWPVLVNNVYIPKKIKSKILLKHISIDKIHLMCLQLLFFCGSSLMFYPLCAFYVHY